MTTKSSRIQVSSRPQKPARVPNKWRNLPAYGHGITPTMKARPVVHSESFGEGKHLEDFKYLMPVSLAAFMSEHSAMIILGYYAVSTNEWQRPCQKCGGEGVCLFQYVKRHRNGKPNYDWEREFFLCPQCLHVGEVVLAPHLDEKEL